MANLLLRTQSGVSGVLLLVMVVLVAAVGAGGVAAYLALQPEVHSSDQTAKFMPDETQVYLYLNLRPDTNQLKDAQDLIERFRQYPGFQSRIKIWSTI